MAERITQSFDIAIDIMLQANGSIVVLGMGKSGIIGQKIAATLASTGQPSFFVHPGEAYHGDLGKIRKEDVALLISNSGETEELLRVLPFLKFQKNKIIALTGVHTSTLANNSDVVLDVGVEQEACNNNLAPTCSTTCSLVMGDALAVTLATKRNFLPEDFAKFHPGGSLGRKLLTRVKDIMHKDNLPFCLLTDSFRTVVNVVTRGRLGLALIMNGDDLAGIITDGDIRRAFELDVDLKSLIASQFMTLSPIVVQSEILLIDAENLMLEKKVNSLVVMNVNKIEGVLQIYDQLKV
jgi:arabinose-5-phosphate isomerase